MSIVKLCQGCLSADRNLIPLGKHVKLYQTLLKTKKNLAVKKQWMFCWECYKILDNVHKFRLKITRAQKLLNDKSLDQYNTLSNLSVVNNSDNCKLIIFEHVKDLPQEIEDIIKYEAVGELKIETQEVAKCSVTNDNIDKNQSVEDDFKLEVVKVEEPDFDDVETFDSVDFETKDFNVIKQELDGSLLDTELLVERKDVNVVKEVKKRKCPVFTKKKYRNIILDEVADKRSLYDKIQLDEKGLKEWIEKKRKSTMKKKFQCERCYCGFSQQKFYDRHLAVRHAKEPTFKRKKDARCYECTERDSERSQCCVLNWQQCTSRDSSDSDLAANSFLQQRHSYECDICGFRFAEKNKLLYHVRCHYDLFACRLCELRFYTRPEMYVHLIHGPHGRQRECRVCGMRFDCNKRKEFFQHYRYMHEYHICDYCGRNFAQKERLIEHIRKHHTILYCKTCDVTFGTYNSYSRHNKEKHVVEGGEQNYCVECNMHFINSAKYNTHLKRSVKHRPTPAIPCPECGKIYTKKISMANHYNLVHLKRSNYHCGLCDTYYLTGHRLRYHQKYFHEKRPKPKNKICKYCGKGFNNNRMLENHIRTHTGERPFACSICPAAFTQKQSLTAHERAAHK